MGTLHSLGLAKAKKSRFLLASTSEEYGDSQINPQHEDYWGHVNPVGPRGVYDEAKRLAEAISMAKSLLNWEPKIPREEGLLKMIDYFRGMLQKRL
ncbi:MAG: hypothetical protein HW406_5 [Candidatus Brocadiaceae bacterium]|nr:hypothetical protein [Candidatus Brocadiaceae bacterium]